MEYISVQEVSNKWNISKRRIQILCREGRINGAKMIGNMWVIPENIEKPIDARTKSPVVKEKKGYFSARGDLKKLLREMYKRCDEMEIPEEEKKTYVLTLLAGTLSLSFIENVEDKNIIYSRIYKDISENQLHYGIDESTILLVENYLSVHGNDLELDNIVSWAYQYSNKMTASSAYSQTQFFTEKYMINYLVDNITEISIANKILDPCCGGGNFLIECLERLCQNVTVENMQENVYEMSRRLYGYDIDAEITKIAVVNIRIKALSIIKRHCHQVSFEIWDKVMPNIFCPVEKDTVAGSLARDNRLVKNVITGELVENDEAMGNASVVVTNPPFATVKGMRPEQKNFLKQFYPISKCDTCVSFMETIKNMLSSDGICGIVSQTAWMHLKSFECARKKFIEQYKFLNIVNLGSGAFLDLSGEKSNVALLILQNQNEDTHDNNIIVQNLCMEPFAQKIERLKTKNEEFCIIKQSRINGKNGFVFSDHGTIDLDNKSKLVYNSVAVPMQGTSTGNSKELVGYFWEHFGDKDWVPASNGGGYCRWEGLNDSVVKWGNEGEYIKNQKGSALRNVKYFNDTQMVFSDTGTSGLNVRVLLKGQIFIASGPGIRILSGNEYAHLAFLNSRLAANYVRTISPKLTIAAGYIGRIPIKKSIFASAILERNARLCVDLKINFLKFRPNNLEYSAQSFEKYCGNIEELAWALLKNDLTNELLKLEIESHCDEYVLNEYDFSHIEREILREQVGDCAFLIRGNHNIDLEKLDKYLARLIDDGCMLKRSRTSKSALGSDGVLEFVSKDLNISPANVVEQICQNPYALNDTLRKYKDLIVHNTIMNLMGYNVRTGVSKNVIGLDDLVEKLDSKFDKSFDSAKWIAERFDSIHKGIFKGVPYLGFKDGEIQRL